MSSGATHFKECTNMCRGGVGNNIDLAECVWTNKGLKILDIIKAD